MKGAGVQFVRDRGVTVLERLSLIETERGPPSLQARSSAINSQGEPSMVLRVGALNAAIRRVEPFWNSYLVKWVAPVQETVVGGEGARHSA